MESSSAKAFNFSGSAASSENLKPVERGAGCIFLSRGRVLFYATQGKNLTKTSTSPALFLHNYEEEKKEREKGERSLPPPYFQLS
jgi:hypothetical protein